MQVNVENVSSTKKILHIEIPEEVVTREVDTAYNELKKTVKIKGFRQGKIPRQVLEKRFKKSVDADIRARMINDSFIQVVKDSNLDILDSPKIDPPELEYKKSYKYQAEVEILPEIGDIAFKGFSLKKPRYSLKEEEVDIQVKVLQQAMRRFEPIEEERPVRYGDYVLIDYLEYEGETPPNDAPKNENYIMKIGNARLAKEVDDALIGKKAGESGEVRVSFSEYHADKKFAGRNVVFKIHLRDIRKEAIPEIDDAFAKNFGEYETLEALKKDIRNDLQQSYDRRSVQEVQEQIYSILLEKVHFEVPDILLEYELNQIVAETERTLNYSNMTEEQITSTREAFREKYRDTALMQARRHMILRKIIAQEKLTLTEEEKDKGIAALAMAMKQPFQDMKEYYQHPDNKDQFEPYAIALLEKKALDLIISNSVIEEVEAKLETEEKEEPALSAPDTQEVTA
jgi:trigger factor